MPSLGSDEEGRRTLVLPIPFGPAVVIALRACRCEFCADVRERTAYWDDIEARMAEEYERGRRQGCLDWMADTREAKADAFDEGEAAVMNHWFDGDGGPIRNPYRQEAE